MLTVSTHDGSVPAPYIITRQKPGFSVALYSHRKVSNDNKKLLWAYRYLTFDGEVAVYSNRKKAEEQAQYMIGF
jgi:hypothetical protein